VRSGFVAVVGRPNVGKSTLGNRLGATKVAITSSRPGTTRQRVRGVLNRSGVQAVLVDTPGLHKPRTELGKRLSDEVDRALEDVDVAVAVLDATQPIGAGDRMVLGRAHDAATVFVAVNKIDRAARAEVASHLAEADALVDAAELFPVSARTGSGVDALADAICRALPEGPAWYPEGMISDIPDELYLAELVREKLLRRVDDELPHSIACRVTEWEWPRLRVEVVVERDSQKGIVIGRGGELLEEVRAAVVPELPEGAHLELHVTVEKNWQRRPDMLDRLGY
jgi:GTP-binding protein Era